MHAKVLCDPQNYRGLNWYGNIDELAVLARGGTVMSSKLFANHNALGQLIDHNTFLFSEGGPSSNPELIESFVSGWERGIVIMRKWKKWKWHDIQPSMVTHARNLCSAFNPSKVHTHTHISEHTHTVNTHPEQWAAIYAAAVEQLGVRCLAQGHLSLSIEGEERAVHSLHLTYNSWRPETQTHNLSITSL